MATPGDVLAQAHLFLLMLRPERLFRALFQIPWYRHMLLDAVQPARWKGRQVLELGSASGELSSVLAQAGASVVAVDQSPGMVRSAAAQGHGVRAVCANALELPMGDQTFDLCVAASLLNVVPEPSQLMQEMLRVTRPGGEILLLFPVQGFSTQQAHDWAAAQRLQGFARAAYRSWHGLARKLDAADMARRMQTLGLQNLRQTSYLGGMVVAIHATVGKP